MKRLICPADEARAIAELKAGERLTVWRDVKPQPLVGPCERLNGGFDAVYYGNGPWMNCKCPYPAGTEVWVAETWTLGVPSTGIGKHLYYKTEENTLLCRAVWALDKWRSPATMPRWASRSRLVVRSVGVEGGRWKYEMEKLG